MARVGSDAVAVVRGAVVRCVTTVTVAEFVE